MDEKEELRKRILGNRQERRPTLRSCIFLYVFAIVIILSLLGLLMATGIIESGSSSGAVITDMPHEARDGRIVDKEVNISEEMYLSDHT